MILLKSNTSWFHKVTHGFFLAQKYFFGKFKREVFLTVYDLKLNKSCYGYLFISENRILLSIMRNLSDLSGIYGLEKDDLLNLVDNQNLQTIINTGIGNERYYKVSTTNPIAFINLNNKYLLLINIQSNKVYYPALLSGAYSVTYLTKKDYVSKLNNLLVLIQTILNNKKPEFDLPTHGLRSFWSKLNIYVAVLVLIIIFPLFIYLMFR